MVLFILTSEQAELKLAVLLVVRKTLVVDVSLVLMHGNNICVEAQSLSITENHYH